MRMKMAAVVVVMLAGQAMSPVRGAEGQTFHEAVIVKGTARHAQGDYALTFGAPVSLPGLSLGAGTYIFRHAASNALQVSSASGVPYKLFLTIATHRDRPTDNYSILVGPGPRSDSPRRILAIFAPGESIGRQFVYAR